MKSNPIAGIFLTVLVTAVLAVPLLTRWHGDSGAVELHARMSESGGWIPGSLNAQVGVPLHLRITSDDVTHSFAIGQMDMEPVDIHPGEMTDVIVTFNHPGKYTYYCTRWCGLNHWRMRGVIEVTGEGSPLEDSGKPLYVTLNLDLDAPHPAAVTPQSAPSAVNGAALLPSVPEKYQTQDFDRQNSPADTWQALRSEASLANYTDQQIWDLVARLYQAQVTPGMLAEGKRLYSQNCAACHGEKGDGNGVMAAALAQGTASNMGMGEGHNTKKPADFTDPASMLGASPALLQGKIIRGGMGTGMPYWGPIFTEDQTWALVAYIRSLQFNLESQP